MAERQGPGETLPRVVAGLGAPLAPTLGERAGPRCLRQRHNALCSTRASRASRARVLTRVLRTGLDAGVQGLEDVVALQEHRAEVCATPAAWWPWTSHAALAPPEATRRPARALWARAGAPCHRPRRPARADNGTRAAAVWGHQRQRPGDRLGRPSQAPGPSESPRGRAVPARWRKTSMAPAKGWSPRRGRPTAPRPARPGRPSTGAVAHKSRLGGVRCRMSGPPDRS
jgi:hypothetical protein